MLVGDNMKTICYGILGPGYIAHRFVEAVQLSNHGEVIAAASYTQGRALAFQEKHKLTYAYDDYVDLLNNPEVDVVYISTRHHDHFKHIMLALSHGKHVLVEKPMVLKQADAIACFEYATRQNLFLMEAQKMVFLPLIQTLKSRLDQGEIGELRLIETSFSFADRFEPNHWMISKHGGGLYATASYGLSFAHYFNPLKVTTINAGASLYANQADRYGVAITLYENGVLAHTRFGTDVETQNKAFLYGSKGYYEIDLFWKNDRATLHLHNQEPQLIVAETHNDMVYEVNHVNECIQAGLLQSPIMNSDFSITITDQIEQIKNIITVQGSV